MIENINCGPGYGLRSGICIPCSPGTYSSSGTCLLAPVGTYVPGFGAAKFEPCLSSHWEGAMNCPLLGISDSVKCPIGNYLIGDDCAIVPAGYYVPDESFGMAYRCEPGSASIAGSSDCKGCLYSDDIYSLSKWQALSRGDCENAVNRYPHSRLEELGLVEIATYFKHALRGSGERPHVRLLSQSESYCPSFIASNTSNGEVNTTDCKLNACFGATVTIAGCPSTDYADSTCNGSPVISIVDSVGGAINSVSTSCGSCPSLSFTAPYAGCRVYSVRQGCFGSSTCSGKFSVSGAVVFANHSNANSTAYISAAQAAAERAALVQFYSTTGGSNWVNNKNWNDASKSVETWFGVVCDDQGYVVELLLSSNNLVGNIPPELAALTKLQVLVLSWNSLSGSVPVRLGSLKSLVEVDVSNNNLGGALLTSSNWTALIDLLVGQNQFTSTIPSTIGSMSMLETLVMEDNHLTGTLPFSLSLLTNLVLLKLGKNSLSGSLSSSLAGAWSRLQALHIEHNKFSGALPEDLCSFTGLTITMQDSGTCYTNCLSAAIALGSDASIIASTGYNFGKNDSLHCVTSQDNALCALSSALNIGAHVTDSTRSDNNVLESTHPISNKLSGSVVTMILSPTTSLPKSASSSSVSFTLWVDSTTDSIQNLRVCGDFSCRSIIKEFKNASQIVALRHPWSYSSTTISSLTVKFVVDCSRWHQYSPYSSAYSRCWGYGIHSSVRYSSSNWACATAPTASKALMPSTLYARGYCDWYGIKCNQYGQIVALELIELGLTGTIPTELAILTNLKTLSLAGNSVRGTIPSSLLTSLTLLHTLKLSRNLFSGQLNWLEVSASTVRSLRVLEFDHNQFDGTLPTSISGLHSLNSFDLSGNLFTGTIPSSLCSLNDSVIDLIGNNFKCYQSCVDLMLAQSQVMVYVESSVVSCSSVDSSVTITLTKAEIGYIVAAFVVFCLLLLALYRYFGYLCGPPKIHGGGDLPELIQDVRERAHVLSGLPIHRAIYHRCSTEKILVKIDHHSETIGMLDFDNKTVIMLAVQYELEWIVIYSILLLMLPFDPKTREAKPVEIHQFAWILVVQHDRYEDAVRKILETHPNISYLLATFRDASNRLITNFASPKCKAVIESFVLFCGRYEMQALDSPHYISDVCTVYLAVDRNDYGKQVAMKFMKAKDQYLLDLSIREKGNFDKKFIIECTDHFNGDTDATYMIELEKRNLSNFRYCIVYPAGDRSLHTIISSEMIAGKDWESIKMILIQVADALNHMHERGVVHADVKSSNIMRIDHRMKLIDINSSALIGKDYAGVRYSSAYLPPEMIFIDAETGQATVRTYKLNPETGTPDRPELLPYSLILANPNQDSWSLGVVLYELCTGQKLFLADVDDDLDQESMHELATWTLECKKRKLRKVQLMEARNLVAQLLTKEPDKRPNMKQVMAHPFITGRKAPRMIGEAAEFDAFISYRVRADKENALLLYDKLTSAGLKVWIDRHSLTPGMDWEEGFCEGLVKSCIFIPILSREAINSPTVDKHNFSKLKETSELDNVLLEHRLCLELSARGLMEKIYPVMIGDVDDNSVNDVDPNGVSNPIYIHYLNCKAGPIITKDVVVASVEAKVEEHLNRLSLGTPLLENMSVKQTLTDLTKHQGSIVFGPRIQMFDRAVSDIVMLSAQTSSAAAKHSVASHGKWGWITDKKMLDKAKQMSFDHTTDIVHELEKGTSETKDSKVDFRV